MRNDPKNYEAVLAEIRPRPGRKPGSRNKVATNDRPSGAVPRGRPCLYGSSSLRRRIQTSNHSENLSGKK